MALRRLSAIRNFTALVRSVDAASLSIARGRGVAGQTGVFTRATEASAIGWRHWTAASAAAIGLIFFSQSTEGSAQCLTDNAEVDDDNTKSSPDALRHWLESVGADVDAICIRDSVDVCFPLAEFNACNLQTLYLQ